MPLHSSGLGGVVVIVLDYQAWRRCYLFDCQKLNDGVIHVTLRVYLSKVTSQPKMIEQI